VLVDTHCHLGDAAFAADRAETLDRAAAAGVGCVVVIGESPELAAEALALAERDARVSATAGIHPHLAERWDAGAGEWLRALLGDARVVAVGETGLDYHYDHAPRARQRVAFEAQLAFAARSGKPAVIHARDADDDVAAILRNQPDARAILHSFSGGDQLLATGIELGHYVSFSGMVTFRNWRRDDAIRRVPPERLLLETDAPYLAPVPFRGKRNEPAYLVEVARRVGEVLGLAPDAVARVTTENAVRVFGARLAAAPGN